MLTTQPEFKNDFELTKKIDVQPKWNENITVEPIESLDESPTKIKPKKFKGVPKQKSTAIQPNQGEEIKLKIQK